VACNGLLVERAGLMVCHRRKVVMITTGCEEGSLDRQFDESSECHYLEK
jgi:hypothetical protein